LQAIDSALDTERAHRPRSFKPPRTI
jgi:hypothetical protein